MNAPSRNVRFGSLVGALLLGVALTGCEGDLSSGEDQIHVRVRGRATADTGVAVQGATVSLGQYGLCIPVAQTASRVSVGAVTWASIVAATGPVCRATATTDGQGRYVPEAWIDTPCHEWDICVTAAATGFSGQDGSGTVLCTKAWHTIDFELEPLPDGESEGTPPYANSASEA